MAPSFWCFGASEEGCPYVQAVIPTLTYNPLIILRPPAGQSPGYRVFYKSGPGSALCPLPSTVLESLLGPDFDRVCEIGFSFGGRPKNPPATKHAVASLLTVQVVDPEAECVVCMEAFTLGSHACEMPCKHIFHPHCIAKWLHLHSSCPVCRRQLPSREMVGRPGLLLWRLPAGGLAMARFAGGEAGELPRLLSGGRRLTLPRGGGLRWFLGSMFRRRGLGRNIRIM